MGKCINNTVVWAQIGHTFFIALLMESAEASNSASVLKR
jgi:hypothetical protein